MMNDQSLLTEFLGVDVSKGKLDFAFADGKETWSIDNAQQPIVAELIGRIKNPLSTIVVMEATGGYEQALVTLLHQHQSGPSWHPWRSRPRRPGCGVD